MANDESTAINQLIANLQCRPVERDSPVPELFVPGVRMRAPTVPERVVAIPALHARAVEMPDDDEATEIWHADAPTRPEDALPAPEIAAVVPISTMLPTGDVAAVPALPAPSGMTHPAIARAMTATRAPAPMPAPHAFRRAQMATAARYGGLGLLGLLAISLGVVLAIGGSDPEQEKQSDRDRAIAIMTGEAPPPVAKEPVAKVPVPAPEVTPIEEPVAAEPAVDPAEELIAEADEIDASEIEMEPAIAAHPVAKHTRHHTRASRARHARAARIKKSRPSAGRSHPSDDPILAAIHASPTTVATPRGAAPQQGSGKVVVASNVAALIYVDGRATGKQAPSAFVVASGDHQITLLDPASRKAKTATVQIASNKAVSVRKDFN